MEVKLRHIVFLTVSILIVGTIYLACIHRDVHILPLGEMLLKANQQPKPSHVSDSFKLLNGTSLNGTSLNDTSLNDEYVHPKSWQLQTTRDVHIPSMVASSAPFKMQEVGQCFRQVLIWRQTNGGRRGDFLCPGQPCGLRLIVNTDVTNLESSDAVILFHRSSWNWDDMHRRRPPGQKWIFYTQESPRNTNGHVIPPKMYRTNSYDYIMTYRQNAHIYGAYGRYNPNFPTSTNVTWTQSKTKLVAWMASNCNWVSWDRTGFVVALSRHIPVSMYGACGPESCPRDESCKRKLRSHKFYLALENSSCRDYITEKVWRNALLNDIVPIVYGPPREDYERLLPPNSFIHVQDFKSMKELAEYLKLLDSDEVRYKAYLEWKRFGSVQFTQEGYLFEPEQICSNVVSRLLADESAIKEGTYIPPKFPADWNEWWGGSCLKNQPKYPIDV